MLRGNSVAKRKRGFMTTNRSILTESKERVGSLTINRPEQLNALNMETLAEIERSVRGFEEDRNVRVIVITGAGEKAFVAGADIKAMKEMTSAQADEFGHQGHSTMNAIESCNKPVIAAVNGYALGGGTELALACDFIYAAEEAIFGLPETTLGLFPGFGGTQRLAKNIGFSRAKEAIFTGRTFTAQEALEWGMVNVIVPRAELMKRVTAVAQKIAANAPIALSGAKKVMNEGRGMAINKALENERQQFTTIFKSEDHKEGLIAFLEKRKPNFQGK